MIINQEVTWKEVMKMEVDLLVLMKDTMKGIMKVLIKVLIKVKIINNIQQEAIVQSIKRNQIGTFSIKIVTTS